MTDSFSPLVQFVWAGVNTVIALACGSIQPHQGAGGGGLGSGLDLLTVSILLYMLSVSSLVLLSHLKAARLVFKV